MHGIDFVDRNSPTSNCEAARSRTAGRAAHTVHGGHDHLLRQTLIALTAGRELGEHNSPGQATLQVLRGRVRVSAGDDSWEGRPGDLLVIPRERHGLHAARGRRGAADRAGRQPRGSVAVVGQVGRAAGARRRRASAARAPSRR